MDGRKESINGDIVEILADMTADWDSDMDGPIDAKTGLVADLQFESIDVVQFIVAIEEKFKCRGLPFEKLLMADGRYVDEITVGEMVEFLDSHLEQPSQTQGAN